MIQIKISEMVFVIFYFIYFIYSSIDMLEIFATLLKRTDKESKQNLLFYQTPYIQAR
jgi:hypothetical protein